MVKKFDILTLFPDSFRSYLEASLLGKALEKGLTQIKLHQLRDYTLDKHRRVDDDTYGGGEGMVLKPEPLARAIATIRQDYQKGRVIYLSPQGRRLTQNIIAELSVYDELLLVCGRYEGIDERIIEGWVDEEISLGDFVLLGGEIPALALVEALVRLIPGVVGKENSVRDESFAQGLLEYPHYTRPEVFEGLAVPQVLLEGNHGEIKKWRCEQSIKRTFLKRPDLLNNIKLPKEDEVLLDKLKKDYEA